MNWLKFCLVIKKKNKKVTLLHKACWKENVELVKLLLSDPNVDPDGKTEAGVKNFHFVYCKNNYF